MKKSISMPLMLIAGVLTLLGTLGCGDSDPSARMIREAIDTNCQRASSMYGLYLLRNKNQGPADEEAFKKFLKEMDPGRLELLGIDPSNPEEILISDRDGKPLKVRWGINVVVRGPSIPIVFEEEGVDGKKMVGFTNSKAREVEQADYDKMWAGEMNDEGASERPGN